MKKEIYSCDRCGCELGTEGFVVFGHRQVCTEEQIRRRLRFFRSWNTDSPSFISYDLCEKCRESLEEWLYGKNA